MYDFFTVLLRDGPFRLRNGVPVVRSASFRRQAEEVRVVKSQAFWSCKARIGSYHQRERAVGSSTTSDRLVRGMGAAGDVTCLVYSNTQIVTQVAD